MKQGRAGRWDAPSTKEDEEGGKQKHDSKSSEPPSELDEERQVDPEDDGKERRKEGEEGEDDPSQSRSHVLLFPSDEGHEIVPKSNGYHREVRGKGEDREENEEDGEWFPD